MVEGVTAMKMLVGTVAVLGALAIGGVPAVAFTLAQADHPLSSTSSGNAADDKPGHGPPEWANSRHNGEKDKNKSEKAKGPKLDKATKHAEKMSSLGREHGEAMRMWAACVSEKAGHQPDDDGFDPAVACDTKPIPPGHLKHDKAAR